MIPLPYLNRLPYSRIIVSPYQCQRAPLSNLCPPFVVYLYLPKSFALSYLQSYSELLMPLPLPIVSSQLICSSSYHFVTLSLILLFKKQILFLLNLFHVLYTSCRKSAFLCSHIYVSLYRYA